MCLFCCLGVTQQLIDETRLTLENVMLQDLRATLGEGGDIAGWRGCFGETLVSPCAVMLPLLGTNLITGKTVVFCY